MITGNCLCGAISWTVEKLDHEISHCHCTMCRKAHGAAFGSYCSSSPEDFSWQSGEDKIVQYNSTERYPRAFCPDCGSVVPSKVGDGDMAIPLGCLNEDPKIKNAAHIFVKDKAPWHSIDDDLPQHNSYPGEDVNYPFESRACNEDGKMHGSCLCGAVAYEVTTPIKVVHNCHCSRCRKARAAAHATNGFTSIDGVKIIKGADKLKIFRPPDAKFFSQVFCTECGSGMPRLDESRGIAIIPYGSLDDAPEHTPDDHIFTGSKATWYEIADDLPQFEEMPG